MNEKREPFSTTLPPKVVKTLRKHALIDERVNMSEMIERYQSAYLRELESKRLKSSLKKQLIAGYKSNARNEKLKKELRGLEEASLEDVLTKLDKAEKKDE